MTTDLYTALDLVPLDFQIAARSAYRDGASGLIEVPTGSGKTYGAIAGPLERIASEAAGRRSAAHDAGTEGVGASRLQVLYITPLKALARDTERSIARAIEGLDAPATVECRTGDVSAARRSRQLVRMPEVLITTPESLSILLSRPGTGTLFGALHTVIIDEWHELLSTKRGTQTELALTRLRSIRPALQTWALSATLGNPTEAARSACGTDGGEPVIVRSSIVRPVDIDLVLPPASSTLPWSGHLGVSMVPILAERLDPATSTLLFTNTRAQAERWYRGLLELRPDLAGRIALHHGSIDRATREHIEEEARTGRIVWTVATSSLDLGIDFSPVELVVQVGSPKSIARLVQRAGRSAHRPGKRSRVLFVPTHALELMEIHAARAALESGGIERREPLDAPLDVLAQHMVTVACGDGFVAAELFREVRRSAAYASLSRATFDWVLEFVSRGGKSLGAYDHYRKLTAADGRWSVRDDAIARLHRMSIGTIDGNAMVKVSFTNGRGVGHVEEQFLSRLKKRQTFYFAGHTLELVMVRNMTAFVRRARTTSPITPTWPGGSLPFSASLASRMHALLESAAGDDGSAGAFDPVTHHVLRAQHATSRIPRQGELLVELLVRAKTAHLFIYPFAGRRVHEGLAALVAMHLQRYEATSFSMGTNDYGIQFEAEAAYPFSSLIERHGLVDDTLVTDATLEERLREALDIEEPARRAFRGIARVAGLVFSGYPGAQRSMRTLQASSSLLYDVFREHEPDNLLLAEARQAVLTTTFDVNRLADVLQRVRNLRTTLVRIEKPSPLAFPLLVEQLTQRRSSLGMEERIERIRRSYALTLD